MFTVSTILINWSPVATFRNKPVLAVEATRPTLLRTQLITTFVILSIMPLATIAAPKHMAHTISQMVFSMPAMPPVDTSSFNSAEPVSMAVGP